MKDLKELKEELFNLIDELSYDGLIRAKHELQEILFYESIEEVELTAEERDCIDKIEEEITRGEFVSLEEALRQCGLEDDKKE